MMYVQSMETGKPTTEEADMLTQLEAIKADDLFAGNTIPMTANGGMGVIVSVGEVIEGGLFGDQRARCAEVTVKAVNDWGAEWGVSKGDTYTTLFTWRAA